jgi:hypothetical protein
MAAIKSYVMDLTLDRSAVGLALNLHDGTSITCTLPIGAISSEFIGRLIEQCQFAGDHMPPPAKTRFVEGVYPTYPIRTSVSTLDHPTAGRTPLLVLDYGGCVLGCAIDAEGAEGGLRDLADMHRGPKLP